VLNIKNIIICGHSNCGAMKGLLTPMPGNQLPAVSSWLTHSQAVLKEMHKKKTDQTDNPSLKLQRAIQQNILTQMDHLRTYPVIAEKLARQELTLHGWFYEFESGEVFIYEEHRDDFINLESAVDDAIEERRNKIVQEIVMNYLEPFSHPHTAKDYHALMHIFSHLSMDLTAIWPMIRTPVLKTLWRELGGLYTGPTDKKFLAMAELGRTTHMTHLKDFQKNIQESSGYHQACSQIIRQSGFLSPQIPLTIPRVIIEIEAFSSRI